MPESQQLLINTCIMASKCKPKQRRYDIDWIFESLLIRIKHRSSYSHLRKRGILPLPSEQTLAKYIEQLHCTIGFQKAIFKCLKFKAGRMENSDKHGKFIFYSSFYFRNRIQIITFPHLSESIVLSIIYFYKVVKVFLVSSMWLSQMCLSVQNLSKIINFKFIIIN